MPFPLTVLAATAVAVASLLVGTVPASAQDSVSAQDRSFLAGAHQSNLTEIAAGRLAQRNGETGVVRSIGALLVTDHQNLDTALKATAVKLAVALPSQPAPHQRAQSDRLAALSGPAFDRAWVNAMIQGHRAALAAGEEELRSGTAPAAKQVARSSAPVIQRHLDELLRAQPTVGAPRGVPAGSGGEAAPSPAGRHAKDLQYGLLAAGLALTSAGALMWARAASWRR